LDNADHMVRHSVQAHRSCILMSCVNRLVENHQKLVLSLENSH